MKVIKTKTEGVVIIEPQVSFDGRDYFFESFPQQRFNEQVAPITLVQDNESKSSYDALRGLHFQEPPFTQSKLMRAVKGKVLDVAIDLRRSSPTFGQYESVLLTEENRKQFFVPQDFAHGFAVLSDEAIFQYKCDNYYAPQSEGSVRWDDPSINVDWQLPIADVLLSGKDKNTPLLEALETIF